MGVIESTAAGPLEQPAGRRGPSAVSTLLVLVVTGALIMAAAYLSDRTTAVPGTGGVTNVTVSGTATGAAPVVGLRAPDFTATSTDGRQVRLSSFTGHPVWLTFGASWCQPCRAENADVEAVYGTHASQGVVVLQVYMSEDDSAVKDYATRVGLTYTTIPDPDERLTAEYRIVGIPSHFFIDASGILRQIKIGSLDPPAMEAALTGIAK